MDNPSEAKIPIYVVAGFLGSGKTTLMERLLAYAVAHDLNPGVLVNDFGTINIDAAQLRARGLAIAELSGGCICCTNASQLPPAVKRLIRNGSRAILVETSGLANPLDLLDQLTMPWLLPQVQIRGVVNLVDAAHWFGLPADAEALARQQVQIADLLIVNKQDLTSPATLDLLCADLRTLNPTALQVVTSQAALDPARVYRLEHSAQAGEQTERIHHNARIASCNVRLPAALDRDCFAAFAAGLGRNVLRAKGLVQIAGMPMTAIWQYLPGQHEIIPFDIAESGLLGNVAVFIGEGLDATELERQVAVCAAQDLCRPLVHLANCCLIQRLDDHFVYVDVWWAAGGPNDALGHVSRREWGQASIDVLRSFLVAAIAHHAELCLHQPWVNRSDAHALAQHLQPQGLADS